MSLVSTKHPIKEEVGDRLSSGFNPNEFLVVSWVVLIVCCGISLLVGNREGLLVRNIVGFLVGNREGLSFGDGVDLQIGKIEG